jgi:hypothetical protein
LQGVVLGGKRTVTGTQVAGFTGIWMHTCGLPVQASNIRADPAVSPGP